MQEDVPEHIKDDLGVIHDGAQRVASIVKGLLKFARQTRPEQVPVNINEIIEVSLRLRAYELETNNIKVVTVLSTRLPLTVADPGQLQQVFLNLTINAETEMKLARGKGKLVIQTEHINDIIRISFKDNGPGIARKNLKKIFDPFFTTREVGKGTGLGLSICHGIISGHGGKIYAESKLGKGATFIVELPVISQHKQVIKRSKSPGKPIGARKARILVVDDEAVVRQLLSQLLKKEGYSVETFDNGREALSRIKKDGYDLILLDVKLPGMSGSEVYERIREISVSLTKRVVFITGDVMGADTESFLARTKAPFIAKPFNLENLKEQIISLLADKHAGNVTRSKPRAKSKKLKAKARK
jgi:CheY-like chemotaxis protein